MHRKPPTPLLAIATVYLASEAAVLLLQFKASILARLAVYSVVLLLAIRGSRGAANFWGFLSFLGGAVTGYSALQVARVNPLGASLLGAYAAFFFLSAAYVFKSRSLAEYYSSVAGAPTEA